MSTEDRSIVEVDARGRVSLGRLGIAAGVYVVTTGSDGSILLEPARVTTELEARFQANQALVDQVTYDVEHLDAAKPARRRKSVSA